MNVPVLRFPEFEGKTLPKSGFEELFEFSSGRNIKQDEAAPDFATPCVRYGELYHMYSEVICEVVNSTNLDVSDLLLSHGDEILLPSAGEDPWDIGSASALTVPNVAVGRTINILRPKNRGRYSQIFVSYYINTVLRVPIYRLARGSSISNVYNSDLKKLTIRLPGPPEQKKIAAFLGVADAKIAALRARVAGLERYKRGLMQALFSKSLRFTKPDGSAFPDWEERRFGTVFDWIKTNSLSRENLNYESGEVQNIHYGDIHTKFKATFRQTQERVPFISLGSVPKGFTQEEFCQVGDVVIADASEDYADIGKAIEIVELGETKLVAGLHTYIARPKAGLALGFSGYLLRSASMRRQIMRIAQGVSVLGVSKTNLEKLAVGIPDLEEQTKIAEALSAIDEKIAAVTAQLDQMQDFKKGLLQQMFV